ncbi:MAG TPA: SRPBCC family protein, partial [Acidobacteriota bacterium]|nr:SRPBCC family protein [Acidobacteriota bacterium]
ITVQTTINAPLARVWECYTVPKHVTAWNHASDDWHSPSAKNDLRVGGRFNYRMEAKDKSAGFDFEGTYSDVKKHQRIVYVMDDGRKVDTTFLSTSTGTKLTIIFDAENENSIEMQKDGWQSILNNFKKYVESN